MDRIVVAMSLFLAIGCEEKKSAPVTRPAEAKPKPAGIPRPQPKLTVTLDGKSVPMVAALAWKSWDGTIQLTASSVPVTCEEVTGDSRALHDSEVTFDVSAAPSLKPDGTFGGEIRSTYFSGATSQISKTTTLTGDGTPGVSTTMDVDFESKSAGANPQTIVAKGTIDALGCAMKEKQAPPLPPAMPATLEIAGQKLPVRSARWSTHGDTRDLELFTGSESCKPLPFAKPSDLRVRFAWLRANEAKVTQIDIEGALLSRKADQTFDAKKVTFKPQPSGPGDIELHADIKVSGYPVKVDGTVTITECPK